MEFGKLSFIAPLPFFLLGRPLVARKPTGYGFAEKEA